MCRLPCSSAGSRPVAVPVGLGLCQHSPSLGRGAPPSPPSLEGHGLSAVRAVLWSGVRRSLLLLRQRHRPGQCSSPQRASGAVNASSTFVPAMPRRVISRPSWSSSCGYPCRPGYPARVNRPYREHRLHKEHRLQRNMAISRERQKRDKT